MTSGSSRNDREDMQVSSSSPSLRSGNDRQEALPEAGRVYRARRSFSHEPAPLKDRFYTTLYRFRYGWNFRSSVEIISEIPIWLLGHCYHSEEKQKGKQDTEGAPPHILAFMEHFYSLTWMTYRTNFSPIPGTTITTDCGWGCMVRSGQMILATALNQFLLGRNWRLSKCSSAEKSLHRQILSWFADSPSCPFSLHTMMRVAVQLGNHPGNWFGPSQLAVLIKESLIESKKSHLILKDLLAYIAHDCTVYVGDVLKLYEGNHDRSLLVLVPVRLGSESLNPIYIPCVKSLLSLDHCVGIIGGKPKHSVYFVGFQDDKLVHLDPHYCQTATEPPEDPSHNDFDIKSYHCSTPRKLPATRMDPSCTIGFLCSSYQEFCSLRAAAEKVLAPPLQKGVYPFFSFSDQSMEEVFSTSVNMHLGSLLSDNLTFMEVEPSKQKGYSKRVKKKKSDAFLEGLTFNDDEDFVVVDCRTNSSTTHGSEDGSEDGTYKSEVDIEPAIQGSEVDFEVVNRQ